MSWQYHINHVHGKLSSGNYAISQAKNFLPLNIRKTLYNSLFKPHMDFGIIAWGGISSAKLKKVTTLQKKCVRNIAGKGYRSHTDPLFSSLNIIKFEDLRILNSCNFMHKFINEKVPRSFKNTFTLLPTTNRTNSFQVEKVKNSFLHQFPTYFLPNLWNSNLLDLKLIESHSVFKKSLKEILISNYSDHVRCYSPTCPDCR